MNEFNLYLANTNFLKSKHYFCFPDGHRTQLDCILVRKKWKHSTRDCRSYLTAIASHCLSLPINLRVYKKSLVDPLKSVDWKKVSVNKNLFFTFFIHCKCLEQILQISDKLIKDGDKCGHKLCWKSYFLFFVVLLYCFV